MQLPKCSTVCRRALRTTSGHWGRRTSHCWTDVLPSPLTTSPMTRLWPTCGGCAPSTRAPSAAPMPRPACSRPSRAACRRIRPPCHRSRTISSPTSSTPSVRLTCWATRGSVSAVARSCASGARSSSPACGDRPNHSDSPGAEHDRGQPTPAQGHSQHRPSSPLVLVRSPASGPRPAAILAPVGTDCPPGRGVGSVPSGVGIVAQKGGWAAMVQGGRLAGGRVQETSEFS